MKIEIENQSEMEWLNGKAQADASPEILSAIADLNHRVANLHGSIITPEIAAYQRGLTKRIEILEAYEKENEKLVAQLKDRTVNGRDTLYTAVEVLRKLQGRTPAGSKWKGIDAAIQELKTYREALVAEGKAYY